MSERSDMHAEFNRSPRIIMVEAPSKEITMQDLVDTLKGVIEKSWNGLDEPFLHLSSGKQALDEETKVGITVQLQNSLVAFAARNTSIVTGTATSADPDGKVLIDSNANFSAVVAGDIVINFTDKSLATVIEVISNTELNHYKLEDGAENDWDIGDQYKIYHVAQCIVSGGNLTAIDAIGQPMSPISPTSFTQIVLTSSASATLQELKAIQHSSFNGGVTIDYVNGVTGTDWPKGTAQEPVNNLTDAKAIAVEHGLGKLYIVGNITFGATDNVDNYQIVGQHHTSTTITVISGCSTDGVRFEQCTLTGTLNGDVVTYRCEIGNLLGFNGVMNVCILADSITLAGTKTVTFLSCVSGVPGAGTPEIDMGGSGRGLGVRGYNGGILIKNLTGDENVSLDMNSGQVKIDSSCEAGTIIVRGISKLTDNSTGTCVVDSTNLVNPYTVSDQVWDEVITEHIVEGTTGYALSEKLDRVLGLSQENYRVKDQAYTAIGIGGQTRYFLTGATIRIYANKSDCNNDVNPIKEYTLTASYDTEGRCTLYKVEVV